MFERPALGYPLSLSHFSASPENPKIMPLLHSMGFLRAAFNLRFDSVILSITSGVCLFPFLPILAALSFALVSADDDLPVEAIRIFSIVSADGFLPFLASLIFLRVSSLGDTPPKPPPRKLHRLCIPISSIIKCSSSKASFSAIRRGMISTDLPCLASILSHQSFLSDFFQALLLGPYRCKIFLQYRFFCAHKHKSLLFSPQ